MKMQLNFWQSMTLLLDVQIFLGFSKKYIIFSVSEKYFSQTTIFENIQNCQGSYYFREINIFEASKDLEEKTMSMISK